MTDFQFFLLIGVPVVINTALFGLLFAFMKAKFDAFEARFDAIEERFRATERRSASIDRRP